MVHHRSSGSHSHHRNLALVVLLAWTMSNFLSLLHCTSPNLTSLAHRSVAHD